MRTTLTRILLTILLLLPSAARGQMPIKFDVMPPVAPDSVDSVRLNHKAFWRASAEVVGMNTALWAFDRYIRKGDFARISLNSIKNNFKHGFEWDNDNLPTNTFLHPYNGNLFFNAGRSNGFNFWQSELFAIGGSAMWEMFMENEYPSTNDIIATPIGGAAIGEVLYRTSDMLIDDRLSGWDRFGRELGVFLVSPIRGLTRILTGRAWAHRPTTGRRFGTPPIGIQFSLGAKMLQAPSEWGPAKFGVAAAIDIEYGQRFEIRSNQPYDYFTISMELQGMRQQPVLNRLQIKGRLLAREFLKSRRSFMSVGMYQHFDYFDADSIRGKGGKVPFKLGIPASVGVGWMFRDVERNQFVFDAYAHANAVILGGILSDYYKCDMRDYNWASGFSIKSGINVVYKKDLVSMSLSHQLYRLFTWSNYNSLTAPRDVESFSQGDKSVASFNVLRFKFNVKLWRHLYATLALDYNHRSTHYRYRDDVRSSSLVTRLLLTYKL